MTEISPLSLRPQVQILLTFRTQGYKEWWAIAEFVDNSISSYILNKEDIEKVEGKDFKLKIKIKFDPGNQSITIEDNAAGIRDEDLSRAFSTGTPPPNKKSLSQFGLGLKAAGIWWADKITVKTTALGVNFARRVVLDMNHIRKTGDDTVVPEPLPSDAKHHGTIIYLSELARDLPDLRGTRAIREYLESIYRKFIVIHGIQIYVDLEGSKATDLSSPLKYVNPEILNAAAPWDQSKTVNKWSKQISFKMNSGKTVEGFAALREAGSHPRTGFVFIWNGKVIVGAGSISDKTSAVAGYKPIEIFQSGGSFRSLRLFGELDVSEFEVTSTKDGLNWSKVEEREFIDKLLQALSQEPRNLLKMADKYRNIEKDENVELEMKEASERSVEAAVQTLDGMETATKNNESAVLKALNTPETHEMLNISNLNPEYVFEGKDSDQKISFILEVVNDENSPATIVVSQNKEGKNILTINKSSQFIKNFGDPRVPSWEGIERLLIAFGIAEIDMKKLIGPDAKAFRANFNDALNRELGKVKVED